MSDRIPLEKGSVVRSETDSYTIIRLLSEAGGSSLTYYAARSDEQLTVLKELYPQELSPKIIREGQRLFLPEGDRRFQRRWKRYVDLFSLEGEHSRRLQRAAANELVDADVAAMAPEYAFFSSVPFEANGTWYIALHTGNGKTMCGDGLNLGEILQRMIAVCTAVRGLHRAGFVHFDIKPDNLFMMPSGQVKLLDFGSMQELDAADRYSYSYSRGFSAPWLLGAAPASGVHADVYSVTAVFFYMLFGYTIDDAEGFENGVPELKELDGRSFPEKLYGHSFSTISAVFSLLRRNLSKNPHHITDGIDALCAEFSALAEQCRREEAGGILDCEEIVRRLCEIYSLMDEFPLNPTPKRVYAEKQKPLIAQSLEPNGAFRACLDAVRRLLYIQAEYEKSLFCLFFLEENTDMSRRRTYEQRKFYEFMVDCCDKLGQDQIRAVYLQKAEKIRLSRVEQWAHQFEEALRSSNTHEHRFDFENMLLNEDEFVREVWCEDDADAAGAAQVICAQQMIDQKLAVHAGRLAEALCLYQPENWQDDARAILTHVAACLSDCEDSFRDRSIDNLLHFAIESGDAALFEQGLGQLSAEHPLHYGKAASIGEWIRASAERFAGAQEKIDVYALYLFLKSVNRLFFESLEEAAVQALCSMLENREKDSLSIWHPHSLIYAHAAILACRLTAQGKISKWVFSTFRQNLEDTISQSSAGIVRLIAEAAHLAVWVCRGDEKAQQEAYRLLAEEIRSGIEQNIFSEAYFSDALEGGSCEALLSKFRFKHA